MSIVRMNLSVLCKGSQWLLKYGHCYEKVSVASRTSTLSGNVDMNIKAFWDTIEEYYWCQLPVPRRKSTGDMTLFVL